jgi:ParB family transcriptional regulator, chromosome partitioning protein
MTKSTKEQKPSGNLSLAAGLLRGLKNEEAALDARAPNIQKETPIDEAHHEDATGAPSIPVSTRLQIRVSDCVSNPYNPREFYPESKIHELALTLKREGQIETIKVTPLTSEPGKYVVIDGERRLRAKRHLGDEFIDAEVRLHQTPQELYAIAYRANNDHERQTIFDDAIAWKRVLDAGVFQDQNSLAQSVGKDKTQISKTLALNALPRGMLERMAEASDRVGLQAAYFIKLIFDKAGEALADRTLSSVLEGKKTIRDLEQAVRNLSDETSPRRRTRSHYDFRHDFTASGAPIGQLKAFPDGRIQLELKTVAESEQQALAERLKEVVDSYLLSQSANPDS